MLDGHLAVELPLLHKLDDVVAEAGAHRLADLARLHGVYGILEGVDHVERGEIAEVALIGLYLGPGVDAESLLDGHIVEVLAVQHTLAELEGAVVGRQGVVGAGVLGDADEDVRGVEDVVVAVVGLMENALTAWQSR